MKTVGELIRPLTHELKAKIIKYLLLNGTLNIKFDNLSDVLCLGFSWKNTTEGEDYWQQLYREICVLEYHKSNNSGCRPQQEEEDRAITNTMLIH